MDDLWLITEVQSLLNSSELQEPVYGHVVQTVCVEMWKMNLRACKKNKSGGKMRNEEHLQRNVQTEKQKSLLGPAMMAPPCWCRSPWKSNAGLVMALHMLFIWPIIIPDFTWGLGFAEYITIHTHTQRTQFSINCHLRTSWLILPSYCYCFTRLWEFLLSLHPELLKNAPLWVHIYFIRIPRQRAERLHRG